ncbi:MAG: hypothetical protein LBC31_04205 [Treponema sp.]|jgi:hypothetical protein|nr:hypothetical protein [Treponema sp.]
MAKKGLCFGVVVFTLLQSFVFLGCAAIKPMSASTITEYGLSDNPELFKSYQYFVSRDIVLTNTNVDVKTDIKSGQAFSNTNVERDVKQILSSTPGVALEVKVDNRGTWRLGIAFEPENDDLLWFYYSNVDDCFYLDYTDYDTGEIAYGGKKYIVSYEQASGISASIKRVTTSNKTKESYYEAMDPLLLYEENATRKETEQRKTLQGRRL